MSTTLLSAAAIVRACVGAVAYTHLDVYKRQTPRRRTPEFPMSLVLPFLALLLATAFCAYHRLRLAIWAAIAATLLVACWLLGANHTATLVASGLAALVAVPMLIAPLRKAAITAPLLKFYTKLLPPLSDTERTALESGTVGFEGQLFSGKPDWDQLLKLPAPAPVSYTHLDVYKRQM